MSNLMTGARLLVECLLRENVERILGARNTGLISHFGCGVSLFGKAARLRQTLQACGTAAARAIYIGDEVRDAEAACKAGNMDAAKAKAVEAMGLMK